MLLEKEIDKYLYDPKLKTVTKKLIQEREELLKIYPGSIGGKYHPPDERGPGGLVKHIKRTVRLTAEAAKHFDLSTSDTDTLVFCAFVHDLSNIDISHQDEYGAIVRDKRKYEWHAELSAQIAIDALVEEDETLFGSEFALTIDGVIRSHMGCWYPGKREPRNNILETIFSLIDFIATRDWVKVEL